MRLIFIFLAMLMVSGFALSGSASAEGSSGHHKEDQQQLVGTIDNLALSEFPYRNWFEKAHTSYIPNESTVEALTSSLKDVQVKAFMGTWCHDSKREVPRLYKILESANFDLSKVSLVALNHEKKTPSGLEQGFNVLRTPTFIFLKDDIEIGRIVETPRESLEKDMLKIVSGQEYKHSYED